MTDVANGGWLDMRIVERSREAEDIIRLVLEAEGQAALPPFQAGAHIEVALDGGLIRHYSLCNPLDGSGRYEIAVLLERDGRGGSRRIHDTLDVGDRLAARAPRNHFPLAADGHSLLFAGGIGITPLLAMAESLYAARRRFDFHVCARHPRRAAFRERLARAPWAAQVRWYFDEVDGDEVDGGDAGAARRRFDAPALIAAAPPGSHLYVCGPQGYIDHVLTAGREAGWPGTRLHCEYFGAPVAAAGNGAGAGAGADVDGQDRPFRLVLARSGQTIEVAADRSAAQALLDAGIDLPLSCEQGICGTCLGPSSKASRITATFSRPRRNGRATASSPRAAPAPRADTWCSISDPPSPQPHSLPTPIHFTWKEEAIPWKPSSTFSPDSPRRSLS